MTKVLVVDDSLLIRQGISALLRDAGIEIVGERPDATTLLLDVEDLQPDLVLLDIRMPPTHTTEGLVAAIALRDQRPGTAVLLLSQYVETRLAIDLVGGDARGIGYLLKDRVADATAFVDAVRRVAHGGTAIDHSIVQRLLKRERRDDPVAALTERERDVLSLMAEGRSNPAIVSALNISMKTVETHIGSILSKLSLRMEEGDDRRVRAVLLYLAYRTRADGS
jgi:DNA-binding NarL/FixJ family response regulator